MSRKSPSSSLRCPRCGAEHPLDERFCSRCRFPLVYAGYENIDPEYTRGELVRVAGGRNQPEAELIQGLLLEEGIPSMLRRSAGFDVPDFLAAGPRDVMVPESGAAVAREALRQSELAPQEAGEQPFGSLALRIFAGLLVVGFAGLLLAWVLYQSVT